VVNVASRSTARTLAEKLSEPKIEYVWSIAYDIYVWGFHEAKHSVDKIRMDVRHVEWLLSFTKQVVKGNRAECILYELLFMFTK